MMAALFLLTAWLTLGFVTTFLVHKFVDRIGADYIFLFTIFWPFMNGLVLFFWIIEKFLTAVRFNRFGAWWGSHAKKRSS